MHQEQVIKWRKLKFQGESRVKVGQDFQGFKINQKKFVANSVNEGRKKEGRPFFNWNYVAG